MGYQTDFVGYLEVVPPLNQREINLVNRISGSIFLHGDEKALRVADEFDEAVRVLTAEMPRGWSNWTACPRGCCLSYDGGDKANHMIPWLKYLMATLLVAGAAAEGVTALEGIQCNHVLSGMVVGSRRDNRELYSITVTNNDVEVELLWPGTKDWSAYPPLAYQSEIDRFRTWVIERNSSPQRDDDFPGWA